MKEAATIPDQFEVLSKLGEGSTGAVYLARHRILDRECALKILHAAILEDEQRVQRFTQEAQALSRLKHPNICSMYAHGTTTDGHAYLAMEYLPGRTLRQILDAGTVERERALKWFIQICDALSYAHQQNIIHRDVKPANIVCLEDEADTVKMVDFGLAKILIDERSSENQSLTHTGQLIGSPAYMSPEQCTGGKLDVRSDIYSLGCLMYEVLFGRQPFTGQTPLAVMSAHVYDEVPAPPESTKLSTVVLKCLSKNAAERWNSVQELKAALEDRADIRKRRPIKISVQLVAVTALFMIAIYFGVHEMSREERQRLQIRTWQDQFKRYARRYPENPAKAHEVFAEIEKETKDCSAAAARELYFHARAAHSFLERLSNTKCGRHYFDKTYDEEQTDDAFWREVEAHARTMPTDMPEFKTELLLGLGVKEVRCAQADQAKQHFEEALSFLLPGSKKPRYRSIPHTIITTLADHYLTCLLQTPDPSDEAILIDRLKQIPTTEPATVLCGIGESFHGAAEYERAQKFFEESLSQFGWEIGKRPKDIRKEHPLHAVAMTACNMMCLKQYDRAEQLLKQAEEWAEQSKKKKQDTYPVDVQRAKLLCWSGRYNDALDYYRKAETSLRNRPDSKPLQLAAMLDGQAKAYIALKEYKQAEKKLGEAQSIAEQKHCYAGFKQLSLILISRAELAEATGDDAGALKLLSSAVNLCRGARIDAHRLEERVKLLKSKKVKQQ